MRGRSDLLTQGDFRWLLGASVFSGIGDWLYNVGLVTLVWGQTHSVGWLAAVEVIALGGSAMFATLAGSLADRFDRRCLMIAADLASAAVMVVLAVGQHRGLGVWFTAASVLLLAAATAPQVPAVVALTPELVPPGELARANGLVSAGEHVAFAAGPALGALALVLGPPAVTFLANGATFVASAALIARIRSRPAVRAHSGDAASPEPARGRWAAIRESGMSPMLVFWLLTGVLFGLEAVLLPVAAERLFGIGIDGYGWLLAAFGVGGLVVVPVSRDPRIGSTIAPAAIALCMIAIPFAALAALNDPIVACAAWAVAGFGTALASVIHDTVLQRRIDPAAVGSIAGTFEACYLMAIVGGSLLAPLLVHLVGVRAALAVPGLLVTSLALVALPWTRRLDRPVVGLAFAPADDPAG